MGADQGYFFFVFGAVGESSRSCQPGIEEVFGVRAFRGLWPLGSGTRNQSLLAKGDKVIFYVSGRRIGHPWNQHCIAEGTVEDSRRELRSSELDGVWLGKLGPTQLVVPIGDISMFSKPVALKPLAEGLHFITNKDRWGVYLQRGIVRVDAHDFHLVHSLRGRSMKL